MTQRRRATPNGDLELVGSHAGLVPGNKRNIDWENVTDDVGGFPKTIRGLLLKLTVTVATVAATMPAEMLAVRLFDAIKVRFDIDGHTLIDGLGGLRLYHDSQRMMGLHAITSPGQPVPDADDAAVATTVYLYIPFALQNGAHGTEMDGALPVRALRREDFSVTVNGDLGGFPGVTVSTVDLDVYADWDVYHKLLVPPFWRIRTLQRTDLEFVTDPGAGFLYYADIFDTEQTAGWDLDHSDYASLQVSVADGRLESWPTPTVPALSHNKRARLDDLGSVQLTLGAEEFVPLIQEMRGGYASKQPMGRIKVKSGTRSAHSTTTVQYRTRGTRTDEWRAAIYRRLGVGSEHGLQLQPAVGPTVPAVLRPHMPEAVVWRGMPYPALVDINRSKFPRTLGA